MRLTARARTVRRGLPALLVLAALASCAPGGPRSPIETLCPPPPPSEFDAAILPDTPIHARTVHAGLKVLHATFENMNHQISPRARAWNPRCGY